MYELRKRVWRIYFYGRNPRIVYFAGNRILCFLDLSRAQGPGSSLGFLLKKQACGKGVRREPPFLAL